MPVLEAISMPMGIRVVTVPMEVPMEKLSTQPDEEQAGQHHVGRQQLQARLDTELTAPMPPATL